MPLVTHSYEIRVLQSAGFTSCSFLQSKYWGFSAVRPLQTIEALSHTAKYRIWTPLGLLSNQKFQAFGEGRCQEQSNEPCCAVQGVLNILSGDKKRERLCKQTTNYCNYVTAIRQTVCKPFLNLSFMNFGLIVSLLKLLVFPARLLLFHWLLLLYLFA